MAWDKTKPANNSALVSAEIRANWDALDAALVAPLTALANNQVLLKGAGPVLAGVPAGTNGWVLTLVSGVPTWVALPVDPGFANPMSSVGDLIRGGSSGTPTRLAVGTNGQWLTLSGGIPAWAALPVDPGFANPMTTLGDLLVAAAAGAPSRLGIGTTGFVLTVVGGVPAWAAGGLANPMTGVGDLIRGGTSGAPTRLAPGTNGHFLTLTAGVPAWAAAPGFANPMTTLGDLITGAGAGAPGRLGIGTTNQVLTVVGGVPTWAAAAGGGGLVGGRLTLSGANLKFGPYQGNTIWINSVPTVIPAGGVTLAPTGATPDTTYYVYAYLNASVLTLERSTTGHATHTDGVEIKSGDPTRTLVGMARAITGPAWADTPAQRFVLSWLNRQPIAGRSRFTADRSTASTSVIELDPEIRCEFLTWGDAAVQGSVTGSWTCMAAVVFGATALAWDGTTPEAMVSHVNPGLEWTVPVGLSTASPLTEGVHYLTLLGLMATNAGVWKGASDSTSGGICRTTIVTQG
jgi:hypothetical protein